MAERDERGATADRHWVVSVAYTHLPSDARVLREAREVARGGAEVTVLAPRVSGTHLREQPFRAVWLPVEPERGRTTVRGQLRFMRAVRSWARSQPRVPGAVHVHNMPDYLWLAVRAWQTQGARVVLDVHDVMSDLALHRFGGVKRHAASHLLHQMERAVWRRADHIVTVHERYRETIVRAGIDPARVSVVLNVPDATQCRPALRRSPPANRFKIVFHGTVSPRTGVLHLVRAMPEVLQRVPQAHLTIIGAGDGVAAVRAEIDRQGLRSAIDFHDEFLPLGEVIGAIADAHLGVAPNEPSRYTDGILPVKLLEYATLGIPAVATRLPLIGRYFPPGSVHLVDTPEPGLLANAIARFAMDRSYWQSVGARAAAVGRREGWAKYRGVLLRALGLNDSPEVAS